MPLFTVQEAFGLALQHHRAGRLKESEALYRQVLAAQPAHVEALHHLGVIADEVGRHDVAVDLIRRAIALDPNNWAAHGSLGAVLAGQNRFHEAVIAYQRALQLKPDYAIGCNNLGNALLALRRPEEAAAAYGRALEIQPDLAEAHFNLSNVLKDGGKFDEALAGYQRTLELKPDFADAWLNLGNVHKERGELDAAVAAYRRTLRWKPDDRKAHSNLIYTLHFHPGGDEQAIAEEHARWNRQFVGPLSSPRGPYSNQRDPERRLRIGYLSPDFRRHPIGYFLLPLLEVHDRNGVEIYGYSGVQRPDDFTERAKKAAVVWRETLGLDDDALAAQIRADEIDILVDLTQHMAGNRLLVFARKPAPIQFSWLGYPASAGLAAIDYRITDHFLDPEESAWSKSVEAPVRLPDCWFCFHPSESPEPNVLPASQAGQITFGCLNNFSKINDSVLELWARVLQAVPGSRLLLHCPAGATQARFRAWFESRGVAADRLELVPRTTTRMEYLSAYQRIDIVLDTFPYNGGTTTCEALWMGVPVVSLAGEKAVSRLGLSILNNLGLPELVASSADDYVGIAVRLAGNLPRLEELRATLRSRMQASPLMDAPRFARNMEAAFRRMWRRWGEEGGDV